MKSAQSTSGPRGRHVAVDRELPLGRLCSALARSIPALQTFGSRNAATFLDNRI
jgi:hypothetical protein